MKVKDILFEKVMCRAYLKKINDGRYIDMDSEGNCAYVDNSTWDGNKVWTEPVAEEDYDGTKHFLKTYYKHTEKHFTGVVVGIKEIVMTAYLTCETCYTYQGSGYTRVEKSPEDVRKCAHVFYGNNRSRLVPLDDLKIYQDESSCDGECHKCWNMECEKHGKEWEE